MKQNTFPNKAVWKLAATIALKQVDKPVPISDEDVKRTILSMNYDDKKSHLEIAAHTQICRRMTPKYLEALQKLVDATHADRHLQVLSNVFTNLMNILESVWHEKAAAVEDSGIKYVLTFDITPYKQLKKMCRRFVTEATKTIVCDNYESVTRSILRRVTNMLIMQSGTYEYLPSVGERLYQAFHDLDKHHGSPLRSQLQGVLMRIAIQYLSAAQRELEVQQMMWTGWFEQQQSGVPEASCAEPRDQGKSMSNEECDEEYEQMWAAKFAGIPGEETRDERYRSTAASSGIQYQ